MQSKLVIVESPAKAKTLGRILGKSYLIRASMGHVRDLPEDKLGIQIDKDFEPVYRSIPARRSVIKEIKELANSASAVYLATDPDREGEAISWHLVKAANLEKDDIPIRRVTFHEITKEAVENAFQNPRTIDMKLVDAQQARRVLDRLVGYKLSPLLWKKVLKGLSAGRVQSAAVRLVVDRERDIMAFVPREFWTIEAELAKKVKSNQHFRAKFVGDQDGNKIDIPDKVRCDEILTVLRQSEYKVLSIQKKDVIRQPAPPFITSTLQQEAWRKLRFTAKRTMMIAQQLYEGLPIGSEGDTGLITYMRTDSTQIAASALAEMREYINHKYGDSYLPASPRVFQKKAKLAQEAHEAIRPTKAFREPAFIKQYLSNDQYKLYELIWKRAIASQMSSAIYDTITVNVQASHKSRNITHLFQASASSLRFKGFMILYIEGRDEENGENEDEADTRLPELNIGELLDLIDLFPEQHFTQPPARYTEATLIKALEQKGIGRPSTYAPIISTILDRGYVFKDSGKLKPEEIGMIVNDLLVGSFPDIVDFNFTAEMEGELDDIAKGKRNWVNVIKGFYGPFDRELVKAQDSLQKIVIQSEEPCPDCGKPMVVKSSRFGKFLACSNYPECKGKKALVVSKKGTVSETVAEKPFKELETTEEPCPLCGKNMVVRTGRFGKFLACSDYPHCKGKKSSQVAGGKCPQCGGDLITKWGKYGRFWACSKYPECKYIQKTFKHKKSGRS